MSESQPFGRQESMNRSSSVQNFRDSYRNHQSNSGLESSKSKLRLRSKKYSNQVSSGLASKLTLKDSELTPSSKVELDAQLLSGAQTARAPVIKKPLFPIVQKRPLIKQSINVFDPKFPEDYDMSPLEEEACANHHMRLFLHHS